MSEHGLFSSYEGLPGAANGQDAWGFFRDAQGFGWLDAGPRAGFTSSRPPLPPWASVFQFSFFSVQCVALRNLLDLSVKNDWSVICPLYCWERWPCVGDNSPSRSGLRSIWSKEVW